MGSALEVIATIALVVAIVGLIRGHVRWAHIASRRTAAVTLLGGLLLAGVGGALSPTPATVTATAGNSTASTAAPSVTPTTAAAEALPSAPAAAPTAAPAPAAPPKLVSRIVVVAGVALPNSALTPGSVFAAATVARICVSGYGSTVRSVSTSLRAAVYARYAIAYPPASGTYEADHLIPLELGGDNTIRNLWPEPQQGGAGYPRKDILENHLRALVCAGRLPLRTAQLAIASNWAAAAVRYSSMAAAVPAPITVPAPRPKTTPPTTGAYYANCTAARAAGVTPLHAGDPGYRSGLDRDGDGIACE